MALRALPSSSGVFILARSHGGIPASHLAAPHGATSGVAVAAAAAAFNAKSHGIRSRVSAIKRPTMAAGAGGKEAVAALRSKIRIMTRGDARTGATLQPRTAATADAYICVHTHKLYIYTYL